uniref:Uncharacterized protein n=1 Tax=Salvator merianae TaxID=96440 RepID=A0A8D0BR40_SALMN
MATGNLVKNCSEEATCFLCQEYFKDPVTVDCGHNFCQVCITQYLEKTEAEPSCPQCRETISQVNFSPNRQLANLVELVKKLQLETQEEDKRKVCGKHQEPLRLFCKEDRMEHKDHNVLRLEEASQEYKVRSPVFSPHILSCQQHVRICQAIWTAAPTSPKRQKGLSAFERMQTALDESKCSWLYCLDDLGKKMEKNWVENSAELLNHITDFSSLIAKLEEKCQQPSLPNVLQITGGLFLPPIYHLSQVAKGTLVDLLSILLQKINQSRSSRPEQFDIMPCVLGCEKFTAERHYWDVEVEGDEGQWVVGVARESIKRKGNINFSPEEGIWAIQYPFGFILKFKTLMAPLQILKGSLDKVRVFLDYEAGCVAFSDACTGTQILTFSSACFAGEGVYPFFQVSRGTTLKCC